ncbi:MAG TPA: DoxX family protein [Stellaceae bacterium]|nr:DoxX family protein [Stellaceae bacterium]
MSVIDRFAQKNEAFLLLLGRVLIAALFLPSGFEKLNRLAGFAATLGSRGVPAPQILAPLGAAVEFLAPAAILLGLKTRYAALILIAFTIIATLVSHRYWEFADAAIRQAQSINFWKNVAIVGGLVFVFVRGSGRIAVIRDE